MTTLYAFCGLPFAGKSTAARALSSRMAVSIVELDAINSERGVGLNGSIIEQADWDRTYAEAYRRLSEYLAQGQTVIFDHGNFSRGEREAVREIARSAGAGVCFVYVRVSEEEARGRWLRNRETHERYDVRDDNFALALRLFDPPDEEPDVLELDQLDEHLSGAAAEPADHRED